MIPPYDADTILKHFPPTGLFQAPSTDATDNAQQMGAREANAELGTLLTEADAARTTKRTDAARPTGAVVATGRHADMLALAARFARMVHFDGVDRDSALALLRAEAGRGRWTRDVSDDEIRRALDGAIDKCRSGEWKQTPAAAPDPRNRRFAFQRADALIAEAKPLAWLIKGILERDSLGLMFGDPGTYKSFVAIDMAASVAMGRDWHGHRVRATAPAFYVAGEGRNGLKRRMRAWEIARNASLDGAPLFVSTTPTALTDDAGLIEVLEVVEAMITQHGKPALIVLDTVARNFGPGDENSTRDMTGFVAACDRLREQTGACVLLVHHSTHADKTRARGSIALKGALDWEYGLTKDAGVVTLHCTKSKDAEPPEPISFRLTSIDLGDTDEDGEPVTSAALTPAMYMKQTTKGKAGRGKNQTAALRVLREGIQRHEQKLAESGVDADHAYMTMDDWRAGCEQNGLTRNRFHETAKSLEKQGLIRIDDDRVTEQDPEFRIE